MRSSGTRGGRSGPRLRRPREARITTEPCSTATRGRLPASRRHWAIVNAAPVNATAFAISGALPDTRTTPESRLVVRTPVLVPFGLQFEEPAALAKIVSEEQPVVVLENNGVLVIGKDVLEAFYRLEVLESTAEALLSAGPLGTLAPMPDTAIDDLETTYGA